MVQARLTDHMAPNTVPNLHSYHVNNTLVFYKVFDYDEEGSFFSSRLLVIMSVSEIKYKNTIT